MSFFKELLVTGWSRNYQYFAECEGSLQTLDYVRSELNQF
jgi:hypothetical protein